MKYCSYILYFSLYFLLIYCKDSQNTDSKITNEKQGIEFLQDENKKLAEQLRLQTNVHWNSQIDVNEQTNAALISSTKPFNEFRKSQSLRTLQYDWSNFSEYNQRQFAFLAFLGTSSLDKDDEEMFSNVTNNMENTYISAKVCVGSKCDLEMNPHVRKIMAESTDYNELMEAWLNWRDATGKRMRKDFIDYYKLGNKAAQLNKLPNYEFKTLDDLWLFPWESPNLKQDMADIWEQVKPLYHKLHAYVRMKLAKVYPGKIPKDGTIPAHLLGDMWAQFWDNIIQTTGLDPYPEIAPIDVTETLKNKGFTAQDMFKISEKFFVDLGLKGMTHTFWEKSVFVKPIDKIMVCNPFATDFYTPFDFRIRMCTSINMMDLVIIHHEMGHIQYYMLYEAQPTVYRDGANQGFHEAIGDLLALSVSTPKHLKKIGLLNFTDTDQQLMTKINLKFQLKMALNKLAYLPYAYIMDKYRWDVFSGEVSPDDLNRHWWQLRGQYQGVSPPSKRSEKDFDPGAKYHIAIGMEYIRYFVAQILQFQFHEKLCSFREANVPLHQCDIDGDKEAGQLLRDMLRKGSSEKWPKVLQSMIGTNKLDVRPMLKYFKPLDEFLENELASNKKGVGWKFNVGEYFLTDTPIIPPEEPPNNSILARLIAFLKSILNLLLSLITSIIAITHGQ